MIIYIYNTYIYRLYQATMLLPTCTHCFRRFFFSIWIAVLPCFRFFAACMHLYIIVSKIVHNNYHNNYNRKTNHIITYKIIDIIPAGLRLRAASSSSSSLSLSLSWLLAVVFRFVDSTCKKCMYSSIIVMTIIIRITIRRSIDRRNYNIESECSIICNLFFVCPSLPFSLLPPIAVYMQRRRKRLSLFVRMQLGYC